MKSSKFIQVISTFSDKEFKEFEKTAVSYFHKNEKMLSFIEFITYHYPNFEEENVSKLNAFRFVYTQGEEFEDIRIREMLSALNKVLKDFLVFSSNTSSDFYYELNLLKQYQKRKLINLYNTQLKIVKSILTKDKFRNDEFFRRTYLLANVENDFFVNKQISTPDDSIQVKLDNLDYYYFSIKLKESCDMLNRQLTLNYKYEFQLLEDVNLLVEQYKDSYLNKAPIKCYYQIFILLQKNENIEQLNKTINTIKNNIENFSKNELKALFDYPQNYCIRLINQGNTSYVKILFELQKYLLQEKLNLINEFLSAASYRNIVSIAIKLKEYDWCQSFIEEYKDKVSPELRDNNYFMNKANLFFALKKYGETLTLLNQVEFTDVYFVTSAKTLMVKAYYALGEYETLSYFITAFQLYLKRNKELSQNYKTGALKFLSLFKKVFKLAESINFLESAKINEKLISYKKDIQKEKNIHNRAWLLEIIETLRK